MYFYFYRTFLQYLHVTYRSAAYGITKISLTLLQVVKVERHVISPDR